MSQENFVRPLRTVRSYVIRSGRMTLAQQHARAENWSRHGLSVSAGVLDAGRIFGREAPLLLEIGFGMGDSLVAMAKANSGCNYIGVEVHPPGVGNLLKLIDAEQLENVKVYQADAKQVLLECIGDKSLSGIQIFFPDPWHKKKHHKRRLVQPDFIQELRSKLVEGGTLHLATDWQPYADHMMKVMSEAQGFVNCASDGTWTTSHDRPQTKFERRGQKLGHGVWDMIFACSSAKS